MILHVCLWHKEDFCKTLLRGYIKKSGPDSIVGIATAYGLAGPGIESRCVEIFRTNPDRP